MKKTKIIKDLVHGYIDIDKYVEEVIDNRSFQRLKNISQLTCHHLFPSANHTRYEHSLGVMYLSEKFFYQLKPLLLKKLDNNKKELDFLEFHLKYASLLHDVGHAVFSHLGEKFYDNNETQKNILDIYPNIDKEMFSSGSKHEWMSCYVICRNFRDILSKIASKEELELDLEYIFRIITGAVYTDNKDYWARNLIINILNSSTIDTDKLDYLMRDNLMTGMVAPHIQIDRLIMSLHIDDYNKLTYLPKGIPGLLSVIDCRDLLYLWVYNHHTVVYTDFLYEDMIEHLVNLWNKPSLNANGIDKNEYFTCSAISEKYVTDDNIRVLLNNEYNYGKSEYSKKVLPQLIERKFLKPLWKTIHEFEAYLSEHIDKSEHKRVREDISNENANYRNDISKLIQDKCELKEGEIFVIKRSNKFYSMSKNADFYVYYEGKGSISLSDIIPQRKFQDNYEDVSFYVFCKDKKQVEVMEALTEILRNEEYKYPIKC